MPWSEGMVYRANPVSSMDMFAAVRMGNNGKRYRWRVLGRRPLGVNQANALLTVYTPLAKADSLITGSPESFYDDIEKAQREKGEMTEAERRLSQAGSAIGLAAAPGAIYGAYQAARGNTGGLPRAAVRRAVSELKQDSPVRRRTERIIAALDSPKTRKAKIAAGAAGAGVLGLQLVNTAGDAVTSRIMANAERE